MNKKLTIEYVRSEFEKEGCTLLSEEYVNAQVKLNYICKNGHDHSIAWGHWQQGKRCSTCAITKPTLEEVKKYFEQEKYELLSTEYINNHIDLYYRCSMNHEHTTKWYNWKLGHRCPTCATNNSKVSYEFISKSFKQYDYTLLSKDYINARQKLDYKCSKGHPNSITWYNWKSGYRCPTCAGNTKLTIEYVKKSFEKDGYSLISTKYSGAHSKLNYICPIGHKHNTNWDCWNRGHRCKTCAIIKHTGSGHHQWKGGLSYEPYCEVWKDKEYKQDIRNRDGNRCLNPGCDSKNPNDLTIHHIDYNKKNCRPSNLITVCRSCNGIANKDRDWHTTWYQAIIKNRYYGGTKWR